MSEPKINRTVAAMEVLYSIGKIASALSGYGARKKGYRANLANFVTDLKGFGEMFQQIAESEDPVLHAAYREARKKVETLSKNSGQEVAIDLMPECDSTPDACAMQTLKRANKYFEVKVTMDHYMKHGALDLDDPPESSRPAFMLKLLDMKDQFEGLDYPLISAIKDAIKEKTIPWYVKKFPYSQNDMQGSSFEISQ